MVRRLGRRRGLAGPLGPELPRRAARARPAWGPLPPGVGGVFDIDNSEHIDMLIDDNSDRATFEGGTGT